MSNEKGYKTICSSGNWHFFIKDENYKFVYLSFYLSHNDVPVGTNITFEAPVEIRIPIDIWRSMIKKWSGTDWGKNEQLDNMSFFGNKMLKDFMKARDKEK